MANEIQADHTTAKTVYAQVRNSVGQIWNTAAAAFQTYATANIADYDIALTEQGTASGHYAADFPAAISAGVYAVVAKERAGGSPAESDATVGIQERFEWSGTAVEPLTTRPTLAQILAGGDVDGYTLEQTLKLCLAALAGKLSGAATTTIVIRAADDSKNRVTATVDSDGNRTTVTLDASG